MLISEEDWSSIQETIYLNSIPGLVTAIKKADEELLEDMETYDPEEEW